MEKRIIAAAMPGAIHAPRMSPYLPITVDQVADEAVRARIVPPIIALMRRLAFIKGASAIDQKGNARIYAAHHCGGTAKA